MNTFLTTRNSDWSPLAELRQEMDRLFDDLWYRPDALNRRATSSWSPRCDIEEHRDHYLITFEMPGIPKDQIKIETLDNLVTIQGEGARRKFQQSFTLPAGVNPEKMEAHYQDGILRVYAPKAESAKPRQIKISNNATATGFFGKLLGQTPKKEKEEISLSGEMKPNEVA